MMPVQVLLTALVVVLVASCARSAMLRANSPNDKSPTEPLIQPVASLVDSRPNPDEPRHDQAAALSPHGGLEERKPTLAISLSADDDPDDGEDSSSKGSSAVSESGLGPTAPGGLSDISRAFYRPGASTHCSSSRPAIAANGSSSSGKTASGINRSDKPVIQPESRDKNSFEAGTAADRADSDSDDVTSVWRGGHTGNGNTYGQESDYRKPNRDHQKPTVVQSPTGPAKATPRGQNQKHVDQASAAGGVADSSIDKGWPYHRPGAYVASVEPSNRRDQGKSNGTGAMEAEVEKDERFERPKSTAVGNRGWPEANSQRHHNHRISLNRDSASSVAGTQPDSGYRPQPRPSAASDPWTHGDGVRLHQVHLPPPSADSAKLHEDRLRNLGQPYAGGSSKLRAHHGVHLNSAAVDYEKFVSHGSRQRHSKHGGGSADLNEVPDRYRSSAESPHDTNSTNLKNDNSSNNYNTGKITETSDSNANASHHSNKHNGDSGDSNIDTSNTNILTGGNTPSVTSSALGGAAWPRFNGGGSDIDQRGDQQSDKDDDPKRDKAASSGTSRGYSEQNSGEAHRSSGRGSGHHHSSGHHTYVISEA